MSLTKKINKLINERPLYKIQGEAFDNQAIAKSRAFGRDRSIQAQESQLDQEAANSVNQATNVTDSTSGLLATLAAINANKTNSQRGLAQDEAAIQSNNIQQLYGANQAVIDEQDKAWDFNVNQPYQNKIQSLRDRKKNRAELAGNIAGAVAQVGAGIATGGLSSFGSLRGGGGGYSEPTWGRGNPDY